MIVKRYVKKSTIYIIAAVMAFLTAGAVSASLLTL